MARQSVADWVVRHAGCCAMLVLLAGCFQNDVTRSARGTQLPPGVRTEPSGFATLLQAPPSTAALAPLSGSGTSVRRGRYNQHTFSDPYHVFPDPDDAARRDARALDQRIKRSGVQGYIGMRIVRDPGARFAFQFREHAKATLARFTSDERFVAREGGRERTELEPVSDAWESKMQPHRIVTDITVLPFDGWIEFRLGIDETDYRTLAAREGWELPDTIRLKFSGAANPRSVDPVLAPLVRVFAREDRVPGMVPMVGAYGVLILRDGCFRAQLGKTEPLVVFGRDVELTLDPQGYMVVVDTRSGDLARAARIGEPALWGGAREGDKADAGVQALHAACGPGEVVAVGEPHSVRWRHERSEMENGAGVANPVPPPGVAR